MIQQIFNHKRGVRIEPFNGLYLLEIFSENETNCLGNDVKNTFQPNESTKIFLTSEELKILAKELSDISHKSCR